MTFIPIVTPLLLDQIGFTSNDNALSCPQDKQCIFIEHCPDVSILVKRNEFPIHRLRQLTCGYSESRLKICCDVSSYSMIRPTLFEQNTRSLWTSKLNCKCGKSFIKNDIDIFGSYPFLARIGFINTQTGYIKYPCSGTIINERTVVTTASCALASSQTYKLHVVAIGEFDSETDPDCNPLFCGHKVELHNISYIVKHPNYREDNFANNIALIRLEKSINFKGMAQPICLLPREAYIETGSNSILIGWGRLSNQKDVPTMQQELKMVLLPKQNCLDFMNQGFSVELCAMGQAEPCSGYNGSPLLYKYSDTYFLVY